MLLDNKSAVIYGGGGSISGAVARAFAREGSRVFLAGRTRATLEKVAEAIRATGGAAQIAEIDALDEQAVDRHADAVAAEAGGIDISFNLITHPHTHGTPLAEMQVDDFMAPLETAARTTFLTARAAARHMIRQRSGVILEPRANSPNGLRMCARRRSAFRSTRRTASGRREARPWRARRCTRSGCPASQSRPRSSLPLRASDSRSATTPARARRRMSPAR